MDDAHRRSPAAFSGTRAAPTETVKNAQALNGDSDSSRSTPAVAIVSSLPSRKSRQRKARPKAPHQLSFDFGPAAADPAASAGPHVCDCAAVSAQLIQFPFARRHDLIQRLAAEVVRAPTQAAAENL